MGTIVWTAVHFMQLSCMISGASGWGWGDDDDVTTTTQSIKEFDNDDLQKLDGWRRNILIVAGLVICIGGSIAILYCCCRVFGSPPDEVASTEQEDTETGNNNERYPRDSFYRPPPRYSALIRSQSQRKARIDLLKKKEDEEGALPRYSAAVRQLSTENPVDENTNQQSPLLTGTEATENVLTSSMGNIVNETSPLNPEKMIDSLPCDSIEMVNEHQMIDSPVRPQLAHAASCSDLVDSPMHSVIMRKKLKERTNSDPPRYSEYFYASTPKL